MKRTIPLCLGVLLFFAAASHLRPAITDEFGTIWLAHRDSAHTIISHVRSSDVHPPTAYLLLHAWGRLFGYGDLAMRAPSALAVLLSMAVLWKLLFLLRPSLTAREARVVFLLCATAPVLLLQAAVARYYALATLLGLFVLLSYLRWMQEGRRRHLAAYTSAAAAAFYLNYIVALLVCLGPFLHYLATWRRPGRPPFRTWFLAHALVAACALPMVVSSILPLLTGANPALVANRAPEGLSGFAAWPAVLAGHLFTTLCGGVPFPWDFWITLPVGLAALLLVVRDLRRERVLLSPELLWLCAVPFVLLALIIAAVLPVAGLFAGAFRVPHLAVLCWVLLGFLVINVQNTRARGLAVAVLLSANLYSLVLFAGNLPSMAQVIPLKGMMREIRHFTDSSSPFVVHPLTHGWGDAVERYHPGVQAVMLDSGPGIDEQAELQKAIAGVRSGLPSQVWLLQRNRFPAVPDQLSAWLTANGYVQRSATDYQRQRVLDRLFKDLLKRIPGLHYSSAPSCASVWTLKRFDRVR